VVGVAAGSPTCVSLPSRPRVGPRVRAGRLATRNQAGQDQAAGEAEQDHEQKAARISQAGDLPAQGPAEHSRPAACGCVDQTASAGSATPALRGSTAPLSRPRRPGSSRPACSKRGRSWAVLRASEGDPPGRALRFHGHARWGESGATADSSKTPPPDAWLDDAGLFALAQVATGLVPRRSRVPAGPAWVAPRRPSRLAEPGGRGDCERGEPRWSEYRPPFPRPRASPADRASARAQGTVPAGLRSVPRPHAFAAAVRLTTHESIDRLDAPGYLRAAGQHRDHGWDACLPGGRHDQGQGHRPGALSLLTGGSTSRS